VARSKWEDEMRTKALSAMVAFGTMMAHIGASHAACNATVNGRPMPMETCALATQIYGYVEPGHYWADNQGNWGRVGVPYPQGNLYQDSQRKSRGRSWTRTGPFGSMGSDGSCTYFNDPQTGGSVMSGNC
jgi:hypothetical protein